eukprot:TRINITY_DN41941_c0_g1_i1.p1 TRINITY_DN41941_c0_g1~~TRINITY_DN41941_c0_g1_i1.p1  ORF type:complete len:267 (-),score=24.51 TRINITY_DN41941_c0_g1_i1:220-1020(-)
MEVAREVQSTLSACTLFQFLQLEYNSVMSLDGFGISCGSFQAMRTHSEAATNLYILFISMLCLAIPTELARYMEGSSAADSDWFEYWKQKRDKETECRAEMVATVLSQPIPDMLLHANVPIGAFPELFRGYFNSLSIADEDIGVQRGFLIHESWFQQPVMVAKLGQNLAFSMRLGDLASCKKPTEEQKHVHSLEPIMKSSIRELLTELVSELEVQNEWAMRIQTKFWSFLGLLINIFFVVFLKVHMDNFQNELQERSVSLFNQTLR